MTVEEVLEDVENTYNCRLTFNDVSSAADIVCASGLKDEQALKLVEALLRLKACNLEVKK